MLSYSIAVSHLSFNFLCLLLLYSIYLSGLVYPYDASFLVTQKEDDCGPLGIQSSLLGTVILYEVNLELFT